MARILYGIHGTGHGHAMRGLTIARMFREHEFLFVTNDDAPAVLEPEFPVYRIPNLGTVFSNYAVDMRRTILRALPTLWNRKRILKNLAECVRDFMPTVCMTDLEYFVPQAARFFDLPCLTLDHQHIITVCRHDLPPRLWWDAFLQGLTPKYLFRPTDPALIVSFYAPPLLPKSRARIVPPLLRKRVLAAKPEEGEHILVYQSNSTHAALIPFLKQVTQRTCYVYGYPKRQEKSGNIVFMEKSEDGFLDHLRTAAYVIQGGSHTLMSEAFFLGKPVLSLPVSAMVEQRFNALYLERLGFGMQASMAELSPSLFARFEERLPEFRRALLLAAHEERLCGNALIGRLVGSFIETQNPLSVYE
ncbi:MAG: teichoic acid biosynthesis protein [Desulfovibrionaceae bacterium]|nr:teichoic acid biosynthesis protein [Desulfovibrionaceae bacterium]